jgi:hypothetical protein
MAFLCVRCEMVPLQVERSEPDFSTANRPANRTQDPEDHTNDHENAADCVQDTETRNEVSDDDQNNPENYHDDSISVTSLSFFADRPDSRQYQ